jgi:hypothetical protein
MAREQVLESKVESAVTFDGTAIRFRGTFPAMETPHNWDLDWTDIRLITECWLFGGPEAIHEISFRDEVGKAFCIGGEDQGLGEMLKGLSTALSYPIECSLPRPTETGEPAKCQPQSTLVLWPPQLAGEPCFVKLRGPHWFPPCRWLNRPGEYRLDCTQKVRDYLDKEA